MCAFASKPRGKSGLRNLLYFPGQFVQRLMEIYDHPDPAGEECIPMVRLRTVERRLLTLRAGIAAYDLAVPGKKGAAIIAGSRLRSFKPSR